MSKLVPVDLRETIKETVTVSVQVKKVWLVRLGLLFIRFGCFLSGANYVEEFPMSLIQNDKPVEINHG